MKRILGWIVTLAVLLAVTLFSALNAEAVKLDFYFTTVNLSLALVVVVAVVLGALIGLLSGFGLILGQRREIVRLRDSAHTTEEEVRNLRALPIKDPHGT